MQLSFPSVPTDSTAAVLPGSAAAGATVPTTASTGQPGAFDQMLAIAHPADSAAPANSPAETLATIPATSAIVLPSLAALMTGPGTVGNLALIGEGELAGTTADDPATNAADDTSDDTDSQEAGPLPASAEAQVLAVLLNQVAPAVVPVSRGSTSQTVANSMAGLPDAAGGRGNRAGWDSPLAFVSRGTSAVLATAPTAPAAMAVPDGSAAPVANSDSLAPNGDVAPPTAAPRAGWTATNAGIAGNGPAVPTTAATATTEESPLATLPRAISPVDEPTTAATPTATATPVTNVPPSASAAVQASMEPPARPTRLGAADRITVRSAQPSAVAKFAALSDGGRTRAAGLENVAAKTEVVAEDKPLMGPMKALGIDGAFTPATMPAGATQDRPSASDHTVVATAGAASDRQQDVAPLPMPVALSTAHRAVEAVLSTVERFSAREQSSVTLQFSVGGNDLNVRVEMRAGEVHTTFRTDSAELRDALAGEWQVVSAQTHADRPVRMSTPVFTSSQDSSSSFSGENAQREQHREAAAQPASFAATASRVLAGSGSRTSSASEPVRSVSANSLHLHTLA